MEDEEVAAHSKVFLGRRPSFPLGRSLQGLLGLLVVAVHGRKPLPFVAVLEGV